MNFSNFCTPSLIYLVLSVIILVMRAFGNFNLFSLLISGFFIILWSWFLNFLCTKGLTLVSWILVILPLFGMFYNF